MAIRIPPPNSRRGEIGPSLRAGKTIFRNTINELLAHRPFFQNRDTQSLPQFPMRNTASARSPQRRIRAWSKKRMDLRFMIDSLRKKEARVRKPVPLFLEDFTERYSPSSSWLTGLPPGEARVKLMPVSDLFLRRASQQEINVASLMMADENRRGPSIVFQLKRRFPLSSSTKPCSRSMSVSSAS